MANTFTVCIVGRPNVGKSTLFNKLIGARRAIVDSTPGVTRDRIFGHADMEGVKACLIDTGGFEPETEDQILSQVREQTHLAIEEADRICFVVDGREGLTNIDREIAQLLRKSGKKVVVAVNKLDTPKTENEMAEFFELGFEKVFAVSAEHSRGFGELAEAVSEGWPKDIQLEEEDEKPADAPVAIAVVGCPNVGKSAIINRILGEKRMTVSEVPGTTRDSIDTTVKWHGREFVFTDTAGIRRKNRISQRLEKYAVIMALKSIARSQVALLIIDAVRGVKDQDTRIAGLIRDEGRACVVLVNKWDLMEKDSLSTKRYLEELHDKLKFLSWAPVLFISAETGQRTGRIFESIEEVITEYRKRVDTGPLNRKLRVWVDRKPPPVSKGMRVKFFYVSQIKTSPPIFSFVANRADAIPGHYRNYLTNRIREEYGFKGSPIVCKFQPRKGRRKR